MALYAIMGCFYMARGKVTASFGDMFIVAERDVITIAKTIDKFGLNDEHLNIKIIRDELRKNNNDYPQKEYNLSEIINIYNNKITNTSINVDIESQNKQ
jgi:hypothetical protein